MIGDSGSYGANADAGQAGQPSEVSTFMCWIVRCKGGRGGGWPAVQRGDRAMQGRTQRMSVGGASRRARVDTTKDEGLCGATADAGEYSWVPSVDTIRAALFKHLNHNNVGHFLRLKIFFTMPSYIAQI